MTARLPIAGALAAGAGALLAVPLLLGLVLLATVSGVLGGIAGGAGSQSTGVSAVAQAEIPPEYLRLYQQAARRYGLDWAILAGIGKVECDHGRDPDPSCTHEGAVNSAGAGGPMQFLASTWARVWRGRRRPRHGRPLGPGRCDLRRGQLSARVGRAR